MFFKKILPDWEKPPKGYGLAYRLYRPLSVYYPVPINLLVSFARWLWLCLKYYWPKKVQEDANRRFVVKARKSKRKIEPDWDY